jgi:hypothetical protein
MHDAAGAEMAIPPLHALRRFDTIRLIPSRYANTENSVLTPLAENTGHLQDLFDLDNATNTRLLGERDGLLGIGIDELVFGVPNFRLINAAFTYARPEGSRFNDGERGAWYCSFTNKAALQEVIFHKTIEYAEIDRFDDSVTYQALIADFNSIFHDLREQQGFAKCLSSRSYIASQKLGQTLLEQGSMGLIYPSVRYEGGANLVCFRPALVGNVRRGLSWRLTWSGSPAPRVTRD